MVAVKSNGKIEELSSACTYVWIRQIPVTRRIRLGRPMDTVA